MKMRVDGSRAVPWAGHPPHIHSVTESQKPLAVAAAGAAAATAAAPCAGSGVQARLGSNAGTLAAWGAPARRGPSRQEQHAVPFGGNPNRSSSRRVRRQPLAEGAHLQAPIDGVEPCQPRQHMQRWRARASIRHIIPPRVEPQLSAWYTWLRQSQQHLMLRHSHRLASKHSSCAKLGCRQQAGRGRELTQTQSATQREAQAADAQAGGAVCRQQRMHRHACMDACHPQHQQCRLQP